MLAFEISCVEGKDKQRKFEGKVSMWLYEVSYVTVVYINLCNEYKVKFMTAHCSLRYLNCTLAKYNACTETAIRFFYSEIQNSTVVPKRSFVFLQRNPKF